MKTRVFELIFDECHLPPIGVYEGVNKLSTSA